MRVAVIGAGAAGLCAARHLTAPESGFTCVVLEQTDCVGGTWVYTETTGCDKNGLPICSAMYKNLRTNLPKENMEFSGFPFKSSQSFVTASEVLHYLESYADHFMLKQYIKFHSHVTCVIPKDGVWKITYINLLTKKEITEEFSGVIICNGHHSEPYMGDFPGFEVFEGEVLHSHDYRIPEPFAGKTVLVCGGGPSGIDISFDLASHADKVFFSHKNNHDMNAFPKNVRKVQIIKTVKKNHVIYMDGTTSEPIDAIIICTGYKYSFPFLTPECGVIVKEDKSVQPLYKHVINVNNPTMGFVGLLFQTFLFPLFDIQVQFFLKALNGEIQLPSKQDMLAKICEETFQNQERGVPLRKYHMIGNKMKSYIEDLCDSAKLERLPSVTYKIYNLTKYLREKHLNNYRQAMFEVVDENNFKFTGLDVCNSELHDVSS